MLRAGLFYTTLAPFATCSRSHLECYAPGHSISLFFLYLGKCAKTGLQVSGAKLFHTSQHGVKQDDSYMTCKQCGTSVDGGSLMVKIF